MHAGGLISEVRTEEDATSATGCGDLTQKQMILLILVPVILLLLIVCIVMFALYLRAERIREEKRRKAIEAKKRAKQRSQYRN